MYVCMLVNSIYGRDKYRHEFKSVIEVTMMLAASCPMNCEQVINNQMHESCGNVYYLPIRASSAILPEYLIKIQFVLIILINDI